MNLEKLLKSFLKFFFLRAIKKHGAGFYFWYLLSTSLKLNLKDFFLATRKTKFVRQTFMKPQMTAPLSGVIFLRVTSDGTTVLPT